ncbi:MAG: hypothetical protein JXB38_17680 [Anaerolineales bacterium]|nr:hypothetical protein [Anaerolineales bacterium]
MNWDAISAIGQFGEFLIVLGGIVLIIRQLKQLKAEETHKKWDTVRWALSLVDNHKILECALILGNCRLEISKGNLTPIKDEEAKLLCDIYDSLSVIFEAASDNYLNLNIYLKATKTAFDMYLEGLEELNEIKSQLSPEALKIIRTKLGLTAMVAKPIRALLDLDTDTSES